MQDSLFCFAVISFVLASVNCVVHKPHWYVVGMAFSCPSGSPQAEGFLPTSICLTLGTFESVLFSRQKEV